MSSSVKASSHPAVRLCTLAGAFGVRQTIALCGRDLWEVMSAD
jgi:hypothetical protein